MPKPRYTVRNKLWSLLMELQTVNMKTYTWSEIERVTGIRRQTLTKVFEGRQADRHSLTYGTMSALMEFFEDEGMPITPNDIYQVTNNYDDPNPP